MSWLFPLSPNKVMFLKVFFMHIFIQTLKILTCIRQYDLTFICVLKCLIDVPPPSVVLEKVDYQLWIVAFAHKYLIELELTPLKIQVYFIGRVNYIKQLFVENLLHLYNEVLLLKKLLIQCCVLRQIYS